MIVIIQGKEGVAGMRCTGGSIMEGLRREESFADCIACGAS